MTYTQQPPANNGMTVEQPEPAHVSVGTKPGDIEMAQPGVAQPMGMFSLLSCTPSLDLPISSPFTCFPPPTILCNHIGHFANIIIQHRPHAPPR